MTLMGFGDESSGSLVYAVRAAAARAGEQEGRVRRLEASLSQVRWIRLAASLDVIAKQRSISIRVVLTLCDTCLSA
jgi:hypothetical protein